MSRLLENAVLLDPQTRRSPHYLIIAASHRAGFLDFPFWSWPLRNLRHLTWVNNSFYGPGGARKLTRDRLTIPVRGFGKLPIHDAIELTIERMTQHGLPMFILADGSQPNMMYGHQVRIKRGLRLLVDECVRRGKPRGRRTFVLPLSFNDPVAFLRGFEPGIEVRFHPPIEITEPSSHQPHISVFDETAINGGDDLLNHLEALYLVNSMQPRHGLSTPDVLAAVRRKRAQLRRALRDHGKLTGHGLREALRARFYTTAMDMCGASVL